MRLSRYSYLIREGFRSITTHGFMSFASVTIIMACLIIMGSVSLLSVNRWSERVAGEAPGNSLEVLLDERFPDERMESVYANMDF